VGKESPTGVELPSGLSLKSENETVAPVGGAATEAILDADNAVIDEGVVAGAFE